mgnify:CR=1 FL=1
MAHVTLIRPSYTVPKSAIVATDAFKVTIGIAYLAGALVKAGHEVFVIDSLGEAPDCYSEFEEEFLIRGLTNAEVLKKIPAHTDVIGISCMFVTDWAHNKTLIHEISEKFNNKLIVIGGEQASSTFEHVLTTTPADIVVVGEGEERGTQHPGERHMIIRLVQHPAEIHDVVNVMHIHDKPAHLFGNLGLSFAHVLNNIRHHCADLD